MTDIATLRARFVEKLTKALSPRAKRRLSRLSPVEIVQRSRELEAFIDAQLRPRPSVEELAAQAIEEAEREPARGRKAIATRRARRGA